MMASYSSADLKLLLIDFATDFKVECWAWCIDFVKQLLVYKKLIDLSTPFPVSSLMASFQVSGN